jgi:hypothetical protein
MQINYQQDVAIDDIQQYLRRDCLEITGIPIVPDENTKDLVIELASAIGEHLVQNFSNTLGFVSLCRYASLLN